MPVTTRQLNPSDWAAFRALRLHALQTCNGTFWASLDQEQRRDDTAWMAMLGDGEQAVFGHFDCEQLVGIASVCTDGDDETGRTALLWGNFILPEYRGRGLLERSFEKRISWVRAKAQFNQIAVHHREGNPVIQHMILKFGFKPEAVTVWTWPDGKVANDCAYLLKV